MHTTNEKLIEGLLGVKQLIAENEIEVLKAQLKGEKAEEEFTELIREGLDLKEIADKISWLIKPEGR